MVEMFEDRSLTKPIIGETLFENKTYYFRLAEHPSPTLRTEIEAGRYSRFFDWHPDNLVGTVCFGNVVGFVNVLGKTYEVKSSKFLTSDSGDDQYRTLLEDIASISQTLPFGIASLQDFLYEGDKTSISVNLYFRYIYFRNLVFHKQKKLRLDYLCDQVLSNLHSTLAKTYRYTEIHNITSVSVHTFKHIISRPRNLAMIDQQNALSRSPLAQYIPCEVDEKRYFPRTLFTTASEINYDTHENRFIKFVLRQIIDICTFVISQYSGMHHLQSEAKSVARKVAAILLNPVFKSIGPLRFIPYQSAVLQTRSGYKELLYHYYESRLAPKGIYSYIERDLNMLDVKPIATLYEYWAFFKVVQHLLGEGAIIKECGYVGGYSGLRFNFTIKKDNVYIYYNRSLTRSMNETYALNFRPDIMIDLVIDNEVVKRYILDAKYKVARFAGDFEDIGEETSSYKIEDLVKMLCYMESIENCDTAVVLYPGNEFIFFEKGVPANLNPRKELSAVEALRGVGAVPISPGNEMTEKVFKGFIDLIWRELALNN